MLVLDPRGSRKGNPETDWVGVRRCSGKRTVFWGTLGTFVGMTKALGGGNDGRWRGAFRFNRVGLGGRESSPADVFRVGDMVALRSGLEATSGSGSSWMVEEGGSSGVTFRVAEGVAGILVPDASTAKSCNSPRSIDGVLNPVMASGDEVDGAVLSRSCASLTEVGTRVNLIDPDAEDVVESIEAFVLGLTLSSGPGELAHGEGRGFRGEIVETASETLVGIAKGDERPVRDTDIRRSDGNSERRLSLGELSWERKQRQ